MLPYKTPPLEKIKNELINNELNPIYGIQIKLADENNFHNWRCSIKGPESTPYESGIFYLDVKLPLDYPFRPPKIKFLTRIYHPNITKNGEINLKELRDKWRWGYSIIKILILIRDLLRKPIGNDSFDNFDNIFLRNYSNYNEIAKDWTYKFAKFEN